MTDKQNPINLFFDFATLISAGISNLEAAKKVAASYPQISHWQYVVQALEQGSRFSSALSLSRLINRFESELISVAEDSGRLEHGLKLLSENQQKRLERTSRLKSKLLYPFAILFVGIIVSSLLTILRAPEASTIITGLTILIKLLVTFWAYRAIVVASQKGLNYWLTRLDSFQSQDWYQLHFQTLLFEVMYWHNCSGIDPKTSFSRISKLFNSSVIKKKLLKASSLCGHGVDISNAMRQAKLPLSNDALQVFSAGEHAGDIENTLKRQLELNQNESDLALDNLIEWIPRIFYFLVLIFAITVII